MLNSRRLEYNRATNGSFGFLSIVHVDVSETIRSRVIYPFLAMHGMRSLSVVKDCGIVVIVHEPRAV